MDLNRFTNKAREAVQKAQQIASDRGNPRIDLEHLFAALLEDPEGIVPRIIDRAGASSAEARSLFNDALSKLPQVEGQRQLDASQELVDVLNRAEKEAKALKDEFVSVEHILLA